MIIIEESTFDNPYERSAFWVVHMHNPNKQDFYCVAKDREEIISEFPFVAEWDTIDRTEYILLNGPAPQSFKRILEEGNFGKIECSVGDGLHQRKWRWSQDSKA